MRVLVTRPDSDAAATAERLALLGHEAIVLPLTIIRATGDVQPEGPFAAIAITSRNAARLLDVTTLGDIPVFAVGIATAMKLGENGFTQVEAGVGSAAALARLIAARLPSGTRVLYACGKPRKADFELLLADAGIVAVPWVVYRAEDAAIKAANAPDVDAVLHYSRESAARFVATLAAHPTFVALGLVPQLCLSADVALAFSSLPAAKVLVAPQPDETSLFSLLAICRS